MELLRSSCEKNRLEYEEGKNVAEDIETRIWKWCKHIKRVGGHDGNNA